MKGIDADFVARENSKVVYAAASAVLDMAQDKSLVRIRRLLERLAFRDGRGERAGCRPRSRGSGWPASCSAGP
jgi:hypothetical protein